MAYFYKLRSECLLDIGVFICAIHKPEFEEYNITILNTLIKDKGWCEIEWEFDSNLTLEDLRDIFEKIKIEDLHRMVETLNYIDIYTGEAYYDY